MATIVMATGCLKDKGFEDQRYGVDVSRTPFPNSVSVPMGLNDLSENVFTAEFKNTTQQLNTVSVVLTSERVLDRDLVVRMKRKDSLVLAYNQLGNRDYDLTVMPASLYEVPSLDVIIPAGQREGRLKLVIPDASKLDVSATYGFGFEIESVQNAGFNIASNMKRTLIAVNVANKYDGVYQAKGFAFLGGNTGAPFTFSYNCNSGFTFFTTLTTSGADRVDMTYQPLLRANGTIGTFGNLRPTIVFDPATNKVVNMLPQAARPPDFPLAGAPMSFPWPGNPTYDSRYDPATRTIYLQYGFSGFPATWNVVDTLVYCRPR